MRERGFNIIELMIVVTILGIISAIAIPVYQGYVTRAKVTEAMLLLDPFRLAVTERLIQTGELPADNAAAGFGVPSEEAGRYVRSIEIRNGIIELTFGDSSLAGRTLTLWPEDSGGTVTWTCSSTLPDHLRPKDCGWTSPNP